MIASKDDGPNPLLITAGFAVAAVALFLVLNSRRTDHIERESAPATTQSQQASWSPPPLQLSLTPVSAEAPGPFTGLPTQVALQSAPPSTSAPAFGPRSAGNDQAAAAAYSLRMRAPAVVVDLGGDARDRVLAQAGSGPSLAVGAAATGGAAIGQPAEGPALSDSEAFAKRVGEETPESNRAVVMRNLSATAPQGTIIPGVLETAINSDLPGFTRAVVSRDVLSFDGKAVLIPRGSRLIGQYKSAVALGQSRAFIIWTRVIRPDGVSIQIGSPGTDELGRGGLTGEVDRHFFRRFSGSILLTVLNAAVASVGRTPSTQITIGSPGAANSIANSAMQGDAIPPTIKVSQGEAINIFLARDLDFSAVESAR